MTMTRNRWMAASLTAAIVAVALVGITRAQSGGVIYGCFKTQNGQLRVIDINVASCLASETLIQWNQTGPQGLQGVQGEQGDPGPRGPSDAYDVYRITAIPIIGTSEPSGTRVLQRNLPAGNFAISATVNVLSNGSGGGLVRCKAESVSGWWYLGVASIGPNAGQTLEATLAGTFTASEAVAGPLTVDCWRQNGLGSAPVVDVAEAVAIQVGTISIVGM